MPQAPAVILRPAVLAGDHRQHRAEVPRPRRQTCRSVRRSPSASISCRRRLVRRAVGVHVEQDAAGVAHQPVGPARDHAGADDAGQRVHPQPAERPRQQQPDDHQHRHRGIRHHMHDGGAHVVVAMGRRHGRGLLLEHGGRRRRADAELTVNACGSGISSTLSSSAADRAKAKICRAPSGRTVSAVRCRTPGSSRAQPETGRHAVLVNLQRQPGAAEVERAASSSPWHVMAVVMMVM